MAGSASVEIRIKVALNATGNEQRVEQLHKIEEQLSRTVAMVEFATGGRVSVELATTEVVTRNVVRYFEGGKWWTKC